MGLVGATVLHFRAGLDKSLFLLLCGDLLDLLIVEAGSGLAWPDLVLHGPLPLLAVGGVEDWSPFICGFSLDTACSVSGN